MDHILIVEDSRTFAGLLRKRLEAVGCAVTWCPNYATAAEALELTTDFDLALLDLNLPDATEGEIVDFVLARSIPSIVFTSGIDDDTRDRIWAKGILDYVVKEGLENIDYLIDLIKDVEQNRDTEVLIVDDSAMQRKHLRSLLEVRLFAVHEAKNATEALAAVEQHPGIQLVITDYHMPDMNGSHLTRALRDKRDKEHLAVIGVSSQGTPTLSARFIKSGANDFLNKPFLTEELYCRVQQNLSVIRALQRVRYLSEHDHLTGLMNRRAFFGQCRTLFANAKRGAITLSVGLIDLDNFKKINDAYGHDAGDVVLREAARVLKKRLRSSDLLCRYGGEEFCFLAVNAASEAVQPLFEDLRQRLEDTSVHLPEIDLGFTASFGVCAQPVELFDHIEGMISRADEMLYEAKAQGKNRVLVSF